jgi:pimeloyl-ACP methyl ester carboxylesterase
MTPLLMLPGMMCDARLFSPQIKALSGERQVTVGDISKHSTVSELAAEILRQAPQEFDLAGLSMGGIVAMEICAQAPHRVSKLALMDTNPKPEQDEVKQKRAAQMKRVSAGNLRQVIRDDMKPNYLADLPGKQSVLDICMDMALSLGPEVFERQSKALRDRPDQQQTLRNLDIPVLILCGAEDRLCPIERHELMHDLIPGSQLLVIKKAGHMPTLEQPEKTTEALKTWLKNW